MITCVVYLRDDGKYDMEGQKHKGVDEVAGHELSKVLSDRKVPVEVTKSVVRLTSLMAVNTGQNLHR